MAIRRSIALVSAALPGSISMLLEPTYPSLGFEGYEERRKTVSWGKQ